MEFSADLTVKVRGKTPLEGKSLEDALVNALRAAKVSFAQSDFLGRRQFDFEEGLFPEASWQKPEEEEEERRNFVNSLSIFRSGPDSFFCPIPDQKLRITRKTK